MKSEVKALTREQREELRRLHAEGTGIGTASHAKWNKAAHASLAALPALLADIDALEKRLEAAERDAARMRNELLEIIDAVQDGRSFSLQRVRDAAEAEEKQG